MAIACSSPQEKADYTESAILYNSMMTKSLFIERDLNALRSDTATTAKDDSLEVISTLFEEWKQDVIDVPGNDKHRQIRRYVKRNESASLTPEQMLEKQKELDVRLSVIGTKLAAIKPNTTNLHDH